MKPLLLAAAATLAGCVSIRSAAVSSGEVPPGRGQPVALLQADAVGLTLLFHRLGLVSADPEVLSTRVLLAEAKAMGAARVELKSASSAPTDGVYALYGALLGFPSTTALGFAVK